MQRLILALIFCFVSFQLGAKIRILTFQANHTGFIEYQHKALQKFLLDDYELIVFNDGFNEEKQNAIRNTCDLFGVKCVDYDPSWHADNPLNLEIQRALSTETGNDFFRIPLKDEIPEIQKIYEHVSIRHCHVIQYALDTHGYDHDDIVVILDGDVFPMKPFSIRELLTDVPIVGIDSDFHGRHYLWVPFIAFDPQRLPNLRDLKFHVDLVDGWVCDSGSHSFHYLKENPDVAFRLFPRRSISDFSPYTKEAFAKFGLESLAKARIKWPTPHMEFYIDYHLIHFGGGSGLHPMRKFQDFKKIMESVLEEKLPLIFNKDAEEAIDSIKCRR